MKKSFMTRALATGLSLAMAFSLTAATNVTVASAASTPAMASKQFAVRVGGATKTYKASTATRKTFKISKATVGNTSKATVTVAASKKGIKVTPGTVTGSTVVKVTFKNIKTKKSTTKKYRCVVKAAKNQNQDPVEEALAISEVKQTASNVVNVTFNKDVSKDVTKDNLTIQSADTAALQLALKSVTFSADGKSAKVEIFGNFVDGTTYKVAYDNLEGTFAASVGAVASVTINTTTVQQNVETPIEFQLFDANGIDVTPSINLDAYTYVTISGNYATAEIDKPSTAKITLSTIGSVATVTVTYNANTPDSADISATQDITCVEPKAVTGAKLFTVLKNYSDKINDESECAKFYQGLSDSSALVAVSQDPNYIYFCATDDTGDVISYDSYEVESSNNNIVSVNVTSTGAINTTKFNNKGGTTGKYALIEAHGNNIGGAQINITATKNGKASYYTIPVTTYKANAATKMTVEVNRTTMSNADDPDYCATITAKLYDAADREVKGHFIAERKTNTGNTLASFAYGSDKATDESAYDTAKAGFKVYAAKADAKTYTFEISGSDNVDNSKAITKRININVRSLPDKLENIDYQLEVEKSTLDIADSGNRTTNVKLYATCNSLFAGYVRQNASGEYTIGNKNVPATNKKGTIKAVSGSAIFGTVSFGNANPGNGEVYLAGSVATSAAVSVPTVTGAPNTTIGLNIKTVYTGSGKIQATPDGSGDVARLGGYTIRFELALDNGTTITKTAGITVKNSYVQPTVKVLSTKVTSLNSSDIINAGSLSTNVDMNNNTSSHESIKDLVVDYKGTAPTPKDNKMFVKYATVDDNISGEIWTFYVPVNTTFVQQ